MHSQRPAPSFSEPPEPQVPVDATPLAQALDRNEAACDSVKRSGAELVMINAVLKQEIPDGLQVGDVAHALQRTDELEVKITDAAQELAEVNDVLAQEIEQRVDLERELVQTRAALASAQNSADKN